MKQRPQMAIDALILEAASRHEFGVSRSSISRELVLTYQKVNDHCEDLVRKRLLEYDHVTRTFYITITGRQMLKLSEELEDHYLPMNVMFGKYRSRIDSAAEAKRRRTRAILERAFQEGRARFKIAFATPLLMMEHFIVYFDECLIQLLPC